MGDAEQDLRVALVAFRRELASEKLTTNSFLAPQALMSTKLLDRIVDLAHHHHIPTLDALREQITWAFLDSHGSKILQLAHQFCPLPLSSPFTTTPLASCTSGSGNVNISVTTSKPTKQNKCGHCSGLGHNSEFYTYMAFI